MPRWIPVFAALATLGAVLGPAARAEDPAPARTPAPVPSQGVTLTIYSSADPVGFDPQQFVAEQRGGDFAQAAWEVPGYGIVKEVRSLDVPAGTGEVRLTDVAAFIDPTTVGFADLSAAGGASVLEQAFRFDLASPDKILERYVDRTIVVETTKDGQIVGTTQGKVLSVNQGTVVLQATDGVLRYVSTRDPGLRLPALPDGLLTKPTLVWKTSAATGGPRLVRTSYETKGLTWRADYHVVLNADATKADVGAWVTLLNLSGASYRNARLKLVAGDVQRIAPEGMAVLLRDRSDAREELGATAGFEEKSFFEYHLYTLGRPADVLEASTQQLALFPTVAGAGVERLLVYDGFPESAGWVFPEPSTDRDLRSGANPKVDVTVRLPNRKANGLGIPFPKGKVRVFQQDDADGSLEFVGEDLIDHTPKDETITVKLGQAFDVVGDRTRTDFTVDTRRRTMTDSYGIVVKNHKATPAKVLVREHLFRWSTWEVVKTSDPLVKKDARTVEWETVIPPDGSKTITYTVRYTW
jgi:hypothetical protein